MHDDTGPIRVTDDQRGAHDLISRIYRTGMGFASRSRRVLIDFSIIDTLRKPHRVGLWLDLWALASGFNLFDNIYEPLMTFVTVTENGNDC